MMKRTYGTPAIEKIEFDFTQQITASGDPCCNEGSYNLNGNDCYWSQRPFN